MGLKFNATSGGATQIQSATNQISNNPNNIAFSVWFTAVTGGTGRFVSLFTSSGNEKHSIYLQASGSECKILVQSYWGDVNLDSAATTGISVNETHHLLVTYGSAKTMAIFIDGTETGYTVGPGYYNSSLTPWAFVSMCNYSSTFNRPTDAAIHSIAIYDTLMNTSDAYAIHSAHLKNFELGYKPASLVFFSPMDFVPTGNSAPATFYDLVANVALTSYGGANSPVGTAETHLTYYGHPTYVDATTGGGAGPVYRAGQMTPMMGVWGGIFITS